MTLFAQTSFAQSEPLEPVAKVDLERYAGTWYEIAKYPNRFQKQCIGNTTATYTQKSNGRIEVLNRCLKDGGKIESAVGEAKIADKETNSKLKVRFAPGFISFLPFIWANYWIINLDPNYQYVAIGEPKRKYFWILSRSPQIAETTYNEILDRAEDIGFDRRKVVLTPQGLGGVSSNTDLD